MVHQFRCGHPKLKKKIDEGQSPKKKNRLCQWVCTKGLGLSETQRMMRWCVDALMRWYGDAVMRWCGDTVIRWYAVRDRLMYRQNMTPSCSLTTITTLCSANSRSFNGSCSSICIARNAADRILTALRDTQQHTQPNVQVPVTPLSLSKNGILKTNQLDWLNWSVSFLLKNLKVSRRLQG